MIEAQNWNLSSFLLGPKIFCQFGFSLKIEVPQLGSEPFQLELITSQYPLINYLAFVFETSCYGNPCIFLSLKNINLVAHVLIKSVFNFFVPKLMPYFWQLDNNPKLKIQYFPLGMLILKQKAWKLDNPYSCQCWPGLKVR